MKNVTLFKLIGLAMLLIIASCQKRDLPFQKDTVNESIKLADGSIVIVKDGKYYLTDDILLTKEQVQLLRGGVTQPRSVISSELIKYWTGGVIPYTIHNNFTNTQRIADAIAMIHLQTSIRLVPRTTQTDYVEFKSNSSVSNSYLGRTGGKQIINIWDQHGYGTVMHEVGHALGLGHEHQRPDRNNFIGVNPNLSGSNGYQVLSNSLFHTLGPMDFGSIMMYPADGNDMWLLPSNNQGWTAQRISFSLGDVANIAANYGPPYVKMYIQDTVIEQLTSGPIDYYRWKTKSRIKFFEDPACTIPYTGSNPCFITFSETSSIKNYGDPQTNSTQYNNRFLVQNPTQDIDYGWSEEYFYHYEYDYLQAIYTKNFWPVGLNTR